MECVVKPNNNLYDLNRGKNQMSDSDGSHSCRLLILNLRQTNAISGLRHPHRAAGILNGRPSHRF